METLTSRAGGASSSSRVVRGWKKFRADEYNTNAKKQAVGDADQIIKAVVKDKNETLKQPDLVEKLIRKIPGFESFSVPTPAARSPSEASSQLRAVPVPVVASGPVPHVSPSKEEKRDRCEIRKIKKRLEIAEQEAALAKEKAVALEAEVKAAKLERRKLTRDMKKKADIDDSANGPGGLVLAQKGAPLTGKGGIQADVHRLDQGHANHEYRLRQIERMVAEHLDIAKSSGSDQVDPNRAELFRKSTEENIDEEDLT